MRIIQHLTIVPTDIASILTQLNSNEGIARQRARERLVKLGASAVPCLIEMLTDPRDHLRWEAAKALSEIGDPKAAPALVQALEDDYCGVRWLAAEALIKLGPDWNDF